MKIKMILIKKQIQQKQQPLKFLNATKTAHFLVPRTLEIAFPSCQISSFSGVHVPRPPRGKGPYGRFSDHRHQLHLQWPLTINVY